MAPRTVAPLHKVEVVAKPLKCKVLIHSAFIVNIGHMRPVLFFRDRAVILAEKGTLSTQSACEPAMRTWSVPGQ
jgi:hypothetical protein